MTQPYPEINYARVFSSLETIMGFPLRRKGRKLYAARYASGEVSPRWDKLACFMSKDNGMVMVTEAGSETLPIYKWLVQYGGCADYAEAHRKLLNLDKSNIKIPEERYRPEIPLRYVYPSIMEDTEKHRDKKIDSFTRYLYGLFGKERTEEVLRMYRVGSETCRVPQLINNEVINSDEEVTIFWYVDKDGKTLHDKRVLYETSGHRSKSYTGHRKYRIDDGFRGKCLYGSNLLINRELNEKIYIVEAEKSAITARCYFGSGIWLACGGMTNLRHEDLRGGEVLIADFDAWPLWSKKFTECSVPKWWETTEGYKPGAKHDIADMIEYILRKRADDGKNLTNEEK